MKLVDNANYDSHIYYIDVSLEETLKRHKTRPIADEVTDEQLTSWYQPKNYLDVPGEIIIDESSSLEDTVKLITDSVES